MKLICLSANPSKPCFVLQFKGVAIMLDCGLDIAQILHFLPATVVPGCQISKARPWIPGASSKMKLGEDVCLELKECSGRVYIDSVPEFSIPEINLLDLSQVDVILVSNYNCMLALPYITEYQGFQGTVYATEPTLQVGRQYMEELVSYVERVQRNYVASGWKQPNITKDLPAPLKEALKPLSWQQCYTRHDIDKCLSKVQLVGFNQKVNIFGAIKVMATSSGVCLGGCNWVIQSEYEKVCYVSGSSTLTTHAVALEKDSLRNSDVLILSCLTQTPLAMPDAMIGEFCKSAAETVKGGGNVLVPCYPCGAVFDLMECLSSYLRESCGLAQIPMYFLSPVSESTLAYSNIFGEWLSSSKQSKIYLPEPPFPHAELASQGRLKNYAGIHEGLHNDYKQPCIVFTGHPSLRMGDVVHFIEMWGKSQANTIIFTEPDFNYLEALGPFQPLNMTVCYCPVDTNLSFNQANKLIRELRPLHLVIPESYTKPPLAASQRTDLTIDWEPSPITYTQGEILPLPIKRNFEKIDLDPELAASLQPVEVRAGTAISMVTASLVIKNNSYLLKPLQTETGAKEAKSVAKGKSYIFGNPNIDSFVEALKQQGISSIKVEDTGTGSIIHLPNDDTLIQVEGDSTHIICEGDETVRIKVRDTLLKCLKHF